MEQNFAALARFRLDRLVAHCLRVGVDTLDKIAEQPRLGLDRRPLVLRRLCAEPPWPQIPGANVGDDVVGVLDRSQDFDIRPAKHRPFGGDNLQRAGELAMLQAQ